jgi:hypothetical protein
MLAPPPVLPESTRGAPLSTGVGVGVLVPESSGVEGGVTGVELPESRVVLPASRAPPLLLLPASRVAGGAIGITGTTDDPES